MTRSVHPYIHPAPGGRTRTFSPVCPQHFRRVTIAIEWRCKRLQENPVLWTRREVGKLAFSAVGLTPSRFSVLVVLVKGMRPDTSAGISEMEMNDLVPRGFDDARIFLLLPQVEVIDDHAHVRVLHRAHHVQLLRAGVEDIAFPLAQRL